MQALGSITGCELGRATACAVALWLIAAPTAAADASGLPEARIAPPGLCAEPPSQGIVNGPLSPRQVTEGAAGAPRLRFAPGAVAANLPTGLSAPPPDTARLANPSVCDGGPGCLGAILLPDPVPPAGGPVRPAPTPGNVDVPPPGSTCGGPGFPC